MFYLFFKKYVQFAFLYALSPESHVSLIQTYASRSRLPSWLGIFAILMLFIAPVISRSLEDMRIGESQGIVMIHCDMDRSSVGSEAQQDVAESSSHSGNHHGSMQKMLHTSSGNTAMMEDSACGYCVLLIHMPLLDMASLTRFWSLFLPSHPRLIRSVPVFIAHFIYRESLPRAPPTLM